MALAAAVSTAALGEGTALADPQADRDRIQARVSVLQPRIQAAIAAHDKAFEEHRTSQDRADRLRERDTEARERAQQARGRLAQLAAEQYRDGGLGPLSRLLLAEDPDELVARLRLQHGARSGHAAQTAALQRELEDIERQRHDAGAAATEAANALQRLARTKDQVHEQLAEAQRLLDSLTEQERAQRRRQEAEASAQAARTSQAQVGPSPAPGAGSPAASGHAAKAFDAAKTRLGKPYVWGATGPDSFDCSGLTMWAYTQAGVTIPRTTYGQITAGRSVPLSQAQVGDLVLFNNLAHVGLYAGNGIVLHAPRPGAVVRYEAVTAVGSVDDVRRI